MHFDKGESQLREMVILDPQWLTNLMSSIITFKHRFVKDGILNVSDLVHIWRPPEYPNELHGTYFIDQQSKMSKEQKNGKKERRKGREKGKGKEKNQKTSN